MANKPKILLIYTGGTIGMVKDFETNALRAFNFDNLLVRIPEIKQLECDITTQSFKEPIDSSNMNLDYWRQIVSIIEDKYNEMDGFVVLHGSDTMSYTASAISFMLENLSKPVVFTGSQLPIGDLRTDAKENLITAIQVASLQENGIPQIQEVCLYFEYKLYRANRTTKINAEHFEAFSSLNYPELAESGVHLKVFKQNLLERNLNPLIVHRNMCTDIAVLKLFPGINEATVRAVLETPNVKGVILETYGAGNAPTLKWFEKLIAKALNKEIKIVNVTQCAGGSVLMGHYETSSHLQTLGVISGKDITFESAVAKLMYLLGEEISDNKFKTIFETPIRGEITA
ncbi:asparaginase [Pseudofulvibacter geojedonensis]|uniref:Asparaginase n=1 Tax=Pseudofulvibacter geojedonensis TaxID=1123758 RepID=A0ABW3I5R4_9FLAO